MIFFPGITQNFLICENQSTGKAECTANTDLTQTGTVFTGIPIHARGVN